MTAAQPIGEVRGVPTLLARFLRSDDVPESLSGDNSAILVRRPKASSSFGELLYARIEYASKPTRKTDNSDWFVRSEVVSCLSPKAVILSYESLRRYFFRPSTDNSAETLYSILGTTATAGLADLRLAWRVRSALSTLKNEHAELSRLERAFNILANPTLRACYDANRRDESAPVEFPYGGFGIIVVAGRLSRDREAFFADKILAYRAETQPKRVPVLLRRCDFLTDRISFCNTRLRLEILLDSGLLGDLRWNLTWNDWKRWLKSRIEVDAMFVRSGRYSLGKGECVRQTWWTALPSRIRVSMADELVAEIEHAQGIYELLGQYRDVIEKARREIQRQPVEHSVVQDWFDHLRVGSELEPQHLSWASEYEAYYFEQLRRRAKTWFLFRDEYLFVLSEVLISEIPQSGHATYIFAVPQDLDGFMSSYAKACRNDIRHNRRNVGTELGFVARIVRGNNKKRWLSEVLRMAGEKANPLDVIES